MFNWVKTIPRMFKSKRLSVSLRNALSQGQPGAWASDHLAESEHFTGWNYVAIRAIAQQAAQANVSVLRQLDDSHLRRKAYGGDAAPAERLASHHPLSRLLKRPSPSQSGASFRYEQVVQLKLTGTCLVWKVPNRLGRTVERYVIPTALATPVRPTRELPHGGFRVAPRSNSLRWDKSWSDSFGFSRALGAVLPAEQVMVIRDPHPINNDDGFSALAAGALWTDTAEQIDRSRWSHLKNGPDPSLIITSPDEINPTEDELDAAAAKFNSKYSGTGNHGKAMFLSAGKVEKLSSTPDEMAYDRAFLQLRDAILALHGVPGVAAGVTDGGSYAAFYTSLKQFTMLTVQPTLNLLAEEETEQQSPEFGDRLTVVMQAASIDDPALLEQRIRTDISAGALTKGEVRALRNMPPFGDARDAETAGRSTGADPKQTRAAPAAESAAIGRPKQPPGAMPLANLNGSKPRVSI